MPTGFMDAILAHAPCTVALERQRYTNHLSRSVSDSEVSINLYTGASSGWGGHFEYCECSGSTCDEVLGFRKLGVHCGPALGLSEEGFQHTRSRCSHETRGERGVNSITN